MKYRIKKVRKHFQKRIKCFYPFNDEGYIKRKLSDIMPVGHKAFIETNKYGISFICIDLTKMFGNAPIPKKEELKKLISEIQYEPYEEKGR